MSIEFFQKLPTKFKENFICDLFIKDIHTCYQIAKHIYKKELRPKGCTNVLA